MLFRKKKEPAKVISLKKHSPKDVQSIQHHKTRIENLSSEIDTLTAEMEELEQDNESLKSVKHDRIDRIVFRMAIIKYEIDIREGLVNGFIHKLD